MKTLVTFLSWFICLQLFGACTKNGKMTNSADNILTTDSSKLSIAVGSRTFTATLYSNATVNAFKSRLPMTINMRDLNANEKFYDLPDNLPANASNPGTVQTGDLMLYGSNTLVLFYKSFPTSYSYTPIGRIDDPSGLATALGSGESTVTFVLND